MNELISVIVPVYKVEKYLRKCVDSILSQTYTNLQVILVDDGSPDNCPQICDEYAKKDNRIFVIHKENGGLSSARNAGLEIALGEYVSFIDSDDYIELNMYEKLFDALKEAKAQVAMCGVDCVDESGKFLRQCSLFQNRVFENVEALQKLHETAFVIACNKLYDKAIFKNLRFPIGKINEDTFIMHEVFYNSEKIITIEDTLYHYVQRKDSIMHTRRDIQIFDDIEGVYRRYIFFQKNGSKNLLSRNAHIALLKYFYFKEKALIVTNQDKQRLRDIKRMIKKMYIRINRITPTTLLVVLSPDIAYMIFRVRNRFLKGKSK